MLYLYVLFALIGPALARVVEINNCVELQALRNSLDANAQLLRDVDCSAIGFTSIGDAAQPFTGSFDGQGFSIYNLTINEPLTDYVALFGVLGASGKISRTRLAFAQITGRNYVAGLVGRNDGEVSHCSVVGEIKGGDSTGGLIGENYDVVYASQVAGTVSSIGIQIGGLIGRSNSGTSVINCSANVEVTGRELVGGLIGVNQGILQNGHVLGTVSGVTSHIGGLIGKNTGLGEVTDCFAVVEVLGLYGVGGLLGSHDGPLLQTSYASGLISCRGNSVGGLVGLHNPSSVIKACYSTATVFGVSQVGGLIGYNGGEVSASYASGVVSGSGSSIGGLVGRNDGKGTVRNCSSSGEVVGGTYVGGLVGDNNGRVDSCLATGNSAGVTEVGGLIGISFHLGDVQYCFSENSASGIENIGGLIGNNDGIVTGSHFRGSVNGSISVGGLVGYHTGVLETSNASGAIVGDTAVGGLVGKNEASIVDCMAQSDVLATGDRVGGFAGESGSAAVISESAATGNVVTDGSDVGGLIGFNLGTVNTSCATGNVSGASYIGGLVGFASISSIIERVYASGSVTGSGDNIGGLLGGNEGRLLYCYALGAVSGNHTIGALVGMHFGTLTHCYAAGCVTGEQGYAGLVGTSLKVDDTTGCYWDRQGTGQRVPAAQGYSAALKTNGKPTEKLYQQSTFDGWDFTHTWCNEPGGSYPYLQALPPALLPTASTRVCPMTLRPYRAWMPFVVATIGLSLAFIFLWIAWQRWQCAQHVETMLQASDDVLLEMVAYMGKDFLVTALLARGKCMKMHDPAVDSPLVAAAASGYEHTLALLLPHAKGDQHESNRQAALQTARYYGYPQVESVIIQDGAASGCKIDASHQARACAKKTPYLDMFSRRSETQRVVSTISMLSERSSMSAPLIGDETEMGEDMQPIWHARQIRLQDAAAKGASWEVRKCLLAGADPNITDQQGMTPLLLAIENGHISTAILLALYRANPFVRSPQNKKTAVEMSVIRGDRMGARELMQASSYASYWPLSIGLTLHFLQTNTANFTEVNLSGCLIGDRVFKQLVDALCVHKGIEILILAFNNITSVGVTYFSQMLSILTNMKEIDLSYNAVDEKGVVALLLVLSSRLSLRQVDLTGNAALPKNNPIWRALTAQLAERSVKTGAVTLVESPTTYSVKPYPQSVTTALLWTKRYQMFELGGVALATGHRLIDGFLLQAMDKAEEQTLVILLCICVFVSYFISLCALRYVYGAWLPRTFSDLVTGVCLLPAITPPLVQWIWQVDYVDGMLALLVVINLIVVESCAAMVALAFAQREGWDTLATLKCAVTVASIVFVVVTVCIDWAAHKILWKRLLSEVGVKSFPHQQVAPGRNTGRPGSGMINEDDTEGNAQSR